ncbi:MAG: MoxR family ATPase [Candidatus Nezhaarchaeales archaeon]
MSQTSQTSKTYACSVCGAIFKTHTELGVHALKTKHFKHPKRDWGSKAPNGVTILPVRASDYYVSGVPNAYIPQREELRIIQAHLANGIPLLFVGPKGTGKTLAFAYFAFVTRTPIIQFDCSEGTKRLDLIGRFILQGDQVKYVLGALPTAISIANEVGKAILVLEEINALTPQMQKVLNQIFFQFPYWDFYLCN